MVIADAQLAQMRAQVAARLPQTAEIQRIEQVSDGAGGWEEQPVTLATVPARLDPLSKQVMSDVIAGQEATVVRYQLTVPWYAPLEANCQVVVDGRAYQVVQLDADHGWRVSRRAIVSEVR